MEIIAVSAAVFSIIAVLCFVWLPGFQRLPTTKSQKQ